MKNNVSINKFFSLFPNDKSCYQYIFNKKYGNFKKCLKCNKNFKYYFIEKRKRYDCQYCGNSIYPTKGTIFYKSKIFLWSWLYIIHKFSTSKNGVSAKKIQRELDVNYKTAWRMGQKIRKLMKEDYIFVQNSIIEIDETFVGRLEQNKHYYKKWKNNKKPKEYGLWDKQVLIGMIDRNNKKVKVFHTKDRKTKTIKKLIKTEKIRTNVIYTDDYKSYKF